MIKAYIYKPVRFFIITPYGCHRRISPSRGVLWSKLPQSSHEQTNQVH
jgi:hypothetical protein